MNECFVFGGKQNPLSELLNGFFFCNLNIETSHVKGKLRWGVTFDMIWEDFWANKAHFTDLQREAKNITPIVSNKENYGVLMQKCLSYDNLFNRQLMDIKIPWKK